MVELSIIYLALSSIEIPENRGKEAMTEARKAFLIQIGAKDAARQIQDNVKKQIPKSWGTTVGMAAYGAGVARDKKATFSSPPISGYITPSGGYISVTWHV